MWPGLTGDLFHCQLLAYGFFRNEPANAGIIHMCSMTLLFLVVQLASNNVKAAFTRERTCPDPFGIVSTLLRWDRFETGTVQFHIWDRLHKWTHLASDSRSDPYRIHQVLWKHKAYPGFYLLGAGSFPPPPPPQKKRSFY